MAKDKQNVNKNQLKDIVYHVILNEDMRICENLLSKNEEKAIITFNDIFLSSNNAERSREVAIDKLVEDGISESEAQKILKSALQKGMNGTRSERSYTSAELDTIYTLVAKQMKVKNTDSLHNSINNVFRTLVAEAKITGLPGGYRPFDEKLDGKPEDRIAQFAQKSGELTVEDKIKDIVFNYCTRPRDRWGVQCAERDMICTYVARKLKIKKNDTINKSVDKALQSLVAEAKLDNFRYVGGLAWDYHIGYRQFVGSPDKRKEEIANALRTAGKDGKYGFTGETMEYNGHTLHRIMAVKNFANRPTDKYKNNMYDTGGVFNKDYVIYNVKFGDKGGWIENESNLSQTDTSWVASGMVLENAKVLGNAFVGFPNVSNHNREYNPIICGNTVVQDFEVINESKVYSNVDMPKKIQILENDNAKKHIEIKSDINNKKETFLTKAQWSLVTVGNQFVKDNNIRRKDGELMLFNKNSQDKRKALSSWMNILEKRGFKKTNEKNLE